MSPILYTFRRCPYAIRARMALAYAKIKVIQHEVDLKNKPQELIAASTKGTVPVLLLEDGQVIDESIDIMRWALAQTDPDGWLMPELRTRCDELIAFNDHHFKPILDNYKYPQRAIINDPVYYRQQAETYFADLNILLTEHRYLLAEHITLADVALFPFVRQFYQVDKEWFVHSPYHLVQRWLEFFLNSELFLLVMAKDKHN